MDVLHPPFTHTDGRVFTYVGTVPHTTRDGRAITLNKWETSCSKARCHAKLIVRCATDTPNEWPNFSPAKYCRTHRHFARRDNARKALLAWHASPEGKAAKALRAQAINGKVERAVYQAVQDLSLADEWVKPLEVYHIVEAAMPPPAPGKRDTRAFRTERALNSLLAKKWLRENDRFRLAVAR